MTIALALLLALGVLATFIGAIAFLRLATPFERLHAASFVAVAATACFVAAAFITDGVTGRSLKMVLILVVLTVTGALANHAVARALQIRGGERR